MNHLPPITEAEHQRAVDLAVALALEVPDTVSTTVAALGAITYVAALADTGTPEEKHRIAVMLTRAAAKLVDVDLPRC